MSSIEETIYEFNWVPIILVIILWILILISVVISNIYSTQDIYEVYDKCKEKEVKYKYFVRIDLNPKSRKKFKIHKDLITVRIYDKNKVYVSTFNIKMALLKTEPDNSNKSRAELKMMINRTNRFPEWGFIKVESTAQKGTIHVYDIEMVGVDTKEHYEVLIDREIKSSVIKETSEMFECKRVEWDPNNETGKPSKFLLINEVFIILYMSANLTLLLFAILSIISDTNPLVTAVISTIASFMVEVIDLMFYRFSIKRHFWRTYGSSQWSRMCLYYLVANFVCGVLSGMVSTIFLLNKNNKKTSEELLLALVLLIILNIALISISYAMKCQLFNKIPEIKTIFSSESKSESKKSSSIQQLQA